MSEKKINKLLKKYKYDGPTCEICGSRVIRDREWICSVCGVVQEKILVGFESANAHTRESDFRKRERESNWDKKLHHKNKRDKSNRAVLEISRKVKDLLDKYLKGKSIYQYQFLEDIILEAILKDGEER